MATGRTMTPDEDFPLRFATRVALAALPWFEEDHGEVVLSDRSVGPVIDTHTHYALPTLSIHSIDMERETPDSNLLLGRCCAHHLDVRANQCFSPGELSALKRELLLGGLTGRGKRRDHTAPNLARDMRQMNVVRSVVLALDLAIPSRHPTDTLRTARSRSEVVGYGSVHPRSRHAKAKLEEQLHLGARGLKLHPPNQHFRPDAPYAMELYRICGRENLPVFWHAGPAGIEPKFNQSFAQMRFYERPIREIPETDFVLGHAGSLQHREAIDIQRKNKNAWLEISGLSLGQLREVIAEADIDRVLFGSDWPFYHPVLPLAKVLVATQSQPELRKKILHDNAARLLDRTQSGARS
ncbi:MAG: amidohydrolase [Polyangiaceae bacterium]|jgi:predicted TIM-barrel fold metal-dependent hydrolase|nr:amidohydrolase [Polyangiaceae bacterium]MBK8942877.1 amidohydrolase [Polyangiaceae bacterium]